MILTEQMAEDAVVTIYGNGYVVYEEGENITVFALHDCEKDYTDYGEAGAPCTYRYDEFCDQPWQLRLMYECRKRMEHNKANCKAGRTVSYDAYQEAWDNALSDHGQGNPLEMIIEQESRREEAEKLHRCLDKLTKRQRQILLMCVVEGMTREEVAEALNIRHQSVTDSVNGALAKLRKMYGVDMDPGVRNYFARNRKK